MPRRMPLAPDADTAQTARPTLADSVSAACAGARMLVSALAGAAVMGASAWFARLVSAALARQDWVGTTTLVLLLVAAFAAAMLLLRELVGLLAVEPSEPAARRRRARDSTTAT